VSTTHIFIAPYIYCNDTYEPIATCKHTHDHSTNQEEAGVQIRIRNQKA
jgi:hypothetical protein